MVRESLQLITERNSNTHRLRGGGKILQKSWSTGDQPLWGLSLGCRFYLLLDK